MADTGRPTKYKEEYVEQAFKLALLGAKDKEIADFFDICEATLNNWKHEYPEFIESLKKGKLKADTEIASSLYEKAKGYEYVEEQAIKIKVDQNLEQVEIVAVKKFSPPDTTACIFWLKNRHPEVWRDKTETAITGIGKHEEALNELEQPLS